MGWHPELRGGSGWGRTTQGGGGAGEAMGMKLAGSWWPISSDGSVSCVEQETGLLYVLWEEQGRGLRTEEKV